VLDALVSRIDVVADGGADPWQLAGGDGGADARAADQDRTLGAAGADRFPHLPRLVRVVDRDDVRVGAEIDRLVPERLDLLEDARAQLHASVVERDRDTHQDR
jgi:hypothetical protein